MHRKFIATAFLCLVATALWLKWQWPLKKTNPIIVAVIDTGINTGLKLSLEPGWNFFDGNADTTDLSGHGTLIAQIISKHCGSCKIIPIKIAKFGGTVDAHLLTRALGWLKDKNVLLVNVSMGVLRQVQEKDLAHTVQALFNQGTSIITAAGRGVLNPFRPIPINQLYPQVFKEVIVVGAITSIEFGDPLANYGPEVDFSVAQQANIMGGVTRSGPTSAQSSLAAAQITGLAAKYFKEQSPLSPQVLRQHLRASTKEFSSFQLAERHGYGVFNSDLFFRTKPEGAIYRTYRLGGIGSDTVVDINATEETEVVTARSNCGAEPHVRVLSKGRSFIFVPAANNQKCNLEVNVSFVNGVQTKLTLDY